MRDPFIRSYADSPPFMGGGMQVRYGWPDRGDDRVRQIREEVQNGGRALYCLWDPLLQVHVLVECLYADEIWNSSYRKGEQFDPFQMDDFGRGGLVTLTPWPSGGPAHEQRWHVPNDLMMCMAISEIRRNNRSARIELKQVSCLSYHENDLRAAAKAVEKEQEAVMDEAADEWGEALHFAGYTKSFVSKQITGD